MYKKDIKGWLKHLDFIMIDVLSLQLSFIVICMITGGLHNPYAVSVERRLAVALFICQAAVIMFTRNYAGVIRRRAAKELFAVTTHAAAVLLFTVFSEFVILRDPIPRLTVILPSVAFIVIAYPLRQINKARILHRASSRKGKKSLVLFTSADLVEEAMKKLYPERSYRDYEVTRIVLIAGDADGMNEKYGVSVSPLNDETMYEVRHDQVDEAFILQSADTVFPSELLDELVTIGIPVDYAAAPLFSGEREYAESRSLGDYKVITKSVRFVSSWQMAVKRLIDIVGGALGCLLTCVLIIFIAPAIYFSDPGPIFFTQERIGQNGKRIKIHKFRSMYMDAEERKKELESENKVKGGLMFKVGNDPRIIGNGKTTKNGRARGIGHFIRRTSIDEFPQFFDVLTGKLSLVGWRPCTLNEWAAYKPWHRIRASMKPGITGMWQVNGRSSVTDFEKVVALDREYLENWNLRLDFKILLKTVAVVISGKGAE